MLHTKKSKKQLFMLGAGFMQGVAIKEAQRLGCTVVAADGNAHAPCAGEADVFVHIDLKDVDRLVDYARMLQQTSGLDGVFTAATDFSASVAAVAQACKLHGHSLEAALNATDKVRMRRCFSAHGVPSPAFTEVASGGSIEKSLAQFTGSFPLVVKPVDNMGARGCRMVRSASELEPAVRNATQYSRSGRVIVEECIEGSEFSIEGLIFDDTLFVTGLADRHIFFPPYFIEMGHTIPSACSEALAREIITVFEQGVRSLGLTEGAVKGDILVKDGKAFVGEIAARLSGGYMSGWTVPYSSGILITREALRLALGEKPDLLMKGRTHFTVPLAGTCPRVSAERAWLSIPGKVACTIGLDEARALPFVTDVFPRAAAGDTVVFPQNNVEKCGNVISCAPTRAQAVFASEQACRSIVVRLAPHQAETDAFLADLHTTAAEQALYPPHVLQFKDFPYDSFAQALAACRYTALDGWLLPDFLAQALDTAVDIQGRPLKELLQQALSVEPALAAVLCAESGSESREQKAAYWKALIRGGIQGLLYHYDCTHAA